MPPKKGQNEGPKSLAEMLGIKPRVPMTPTPSGGSGDVPSLLSPGPTPRKTPAVGTPGAGLATPSARKDATGATPTGAAGGAALASSPLSALDGTGAYGACVHLAADRSLREFERASLSKLPVVALSPVAMARLGIAAGELVAVTATLAVEVAAAATPAAQPTAATPASATQAAATAADPEAESAPAATPAKARLTGAAAHLEHMRALASTPKAPGTPGQPQTTPAAATPVPAAACMLAPAASAPATWLCEAWPLQTVAVGACRLGDAPAAAAAALVATSRADGSVGAARLASQAQGGSFSAAVAAGSTVTVSVLRARPVALASVTLLPLAPPTAPLAAGNASAGKAPAAAAAVPTSSTAALFASAASRAALTALVGVPLLAHAALTVNAAHAAGKAAPTQPCAFSGACVSFLPVDAVPADARARVGPATPLLVTAATRVTVAGEQGAHAGRALARDPQSGLLVSAPAQQVVVAAAAGPTDGTALSTAPPPGAPSLLHAVGGLARELAALREVVHLPLLAPHLFTAFGVRPPRGVLLFGPPGTGKTMIARALAAEAFSSFFALSGAEVTGKYVGESEARVKQVFAQAAAAAPAVVFIDEIDAMCPSRDAAAGGGGSDEVQKRIVSTLLTVMDGMGAMDRVVVLAATNRPQVLDPALRRPGRFDREIEIGVPTREGRADILAKALAPMGPACAVARADVEALSASAHGYTGADLQLVVREAALACVQRTATAGGGDAGAVRLQRCDLASGIALVKPSAMREVAVDVPAVRWADIGGQEGVKQQLREAFEWPLEDPEVFARLGVAPPRGILLYGPPGCSKTLLAKALATESSRNFIAVKGPELFSKWVGDSEKAVREVFRKARAAAPSIVFFDEIDSIAVARSASGGGDPVVERVLSQLLVELDGVQPLNDVTVLAATNRPDLLDKALLRPGRIDRAVYVAPPDRASAEAILRIEYRRMAVAPDALEPAAVAAVADAVHAKGLSGAEISALCREAALLAMHEDVRAESVAQRHLLSAAARAEPRISADMLAFFAKYRQTAELADA